MHDVFVSHSEKDVAVVLELTRGIEAAGYTTWYYERDNVPGQSYLIQVGRAIEESRCMILIVSRASLESSHVTSEVVRAYEGNIPCIPLLLDVTHKEVQLCQQIWRQALVTSTSLPIPAGGIRVVLPRVLRGLENLGIPRRDKQESPPGPTSVGHTVPPRKLPVWMWLVPGALALLVTGFFVLVLSLRSGNTSQRLQEDRNRRATAQQNPQPADTAHAAPRTESGAKGMDEGQTVPQKRERQSIPPATPITPASPTHADFVVLLADSSGDAQRILTTALQGQGLRVIGREAVTPDLQTYADKAILGNDGDALELARRLHAGSAILGRVRVIDVAQGYGFFSVRAEIDVRRLDAGSDQPPDRWTASRKAVKPTREAAMRAAIEAAASEAVLQMGDLKPIKSHGKN